MSKLPQTDELPHAGEVYDPARVEEAFATFAERVRELEAVASELRAELHALRSERPPTRLDDEAWPAEPRAPFASPDWVAAVPPPLQRGVAVPRLALEAGFLLLAGLFAGLADLSTAWIVLVMTAAWGLVALAEWAAAARRARWRLDEIAAPLEAAEAAETTGPWDMPVVEATVVDAGPDPESKTVVTKLPAEPEPFESEPPEPEAPVQETAKRRRRFFRRGRDGEAAAADPWEA